MKNILFIIFFLIGAQSQASERKALENFLHSTAFFTLQKKLQTYDNDINEFLDPYIEIIECQYKNKDFLSKKHNGIMLCILEQTLAYLFDSKDLNHSIMFKYYGKNKKDIRIGYLNIKSFIRLHNIWWPGEIYRDIIDQFFNVSLRLKLVNNIKVDIPDIFGTYVYDEVLINFDALYSYSINKQYEVLFYHAGEFQHRGWLDIKDMEDSYQIDYRSDYSIWEKL
ncbi:MAG: hypothetical protein MK008_11745 [Bdellovibrionales bacterium]|nr:hypothetical protein [Bdellovibrionales bacterium]